MIRLQNMASLIPLKLSWNNFILCSAIFIIFSILFFPLLIEARFTNERHVYVRGVQISLEFQSSTEYVLFDVSGWLPEKVRVIDCTAHYTINSSLLRAADYDVRATPVQMGKDANEPVIFPLTIAPKPNPQRYPVWHWGGLPPEDLKYWTDRGFNGFRIHSLRAPLNENTNTQRLESLLEEGARLGADIGLYFHPLLWNGWTNRQEARCLLPTGRRDPKKVYPLEPEVVKHSQKTIDSWMDRFADYPSLKHAHLSSEYPTPFCVNDLAIKLAGSETGIDLKQYWNEGLIPDKYGRLRLGQLPEAIKPQNGIIADDNPMYKMLMWWWQSGNGIAKLNAMMTDMIHSRRDDILVWHDPYRLSPVYGTHEGLDAISTWTYGHPDIKRLGYTRALQAAARKNSLKVMQTITLFVYKHFVMPDDISFEDLFFDFPDDKLNFTKGPDYAREAMWLVFSQRPDIISFYYAGRHYPNRPAQSPTITSPETFDAIGEINRTLIEPYGPAILQGEPRKANAAVLMSAAAVWFRDNPKWCGYPNESILPFGILLMMNHMPFDVLLDEDIAEGRLNEYELLVIPYGDALTQTVHQKIVAFGRSGKTVIADTTLKADIPGAHVMDIDFGFMDRADGRALEKGNAITAEEYQTRMEALAEKLAPKLAGIFKPYRCNSKQVLINEVTSGEVRYVFVINDKKTYGPRFGQWKLHQELGVEQKPEIKIAVTGEPAIYDALNLSPTEYRLSDGFAVINTSLSGARGKLIVVLPRSIEQVRITGPESVKRGGEGIFRIEVLDVSKNPFKGAIPLKIELTDSAGRKSEFSRFASTVFLESSSWAYDLTFHPAINDLSGEWSLKVFELVSGKTVEHKITVQ